MTEAVVRRCPNRKCNVPFQKGSDNECNKIICAACGTKSCYVCRQEIKLEKPYLHFCRIPHCQHKDCGKCVLFTKAKEDDERLRRRVALAQVQNARAVGNNLEILLSPQRPPPRQAHVVVPNQAAVAQVVNQVPVVPVVVRGLEPAPQVVDVPAAVAQVVNQVPAVVPLVVRGREPAPQVVNVPAAVAQVVNQVPVVPLVVRGREPAPQVVDVPAAVAQVAARGCIMM
jgi:hypothetical protein